MVLRVLFFKCDSNEFHEDYAWLAQGIDLDIVAQGRTFEQVRDRFITTVVGQVLLNVKNGNSAFSSIERASVENIKRYEKSYCIDSKINHVIDFHRYSIKNDDGKDSTSIDLELDFLPRVELI